MTRKGYQALAKAVASIEDRILRRKVAGILAKVLSDQNANFKTALFLRACEEQPHD